MGLIRPYKKDKCTPLEQFMIETAMLLDCLPSFVDPTLSGENSHIKLRIEKLLSTECAYNQTLEPTNTTEPLQDTE